MGVDGNSKLGILVAPVTREAGSMPFFQSGDTLLHFPDLGLLQRIVSELDGADRAAVQIIKLGMPSERGTFMINNPTQPHSQLELGLLRRAHRVFYVPQDCTPPFPEWTFRMPEDPNSRRHVLGGDLDGRDLGRLLFDDSQQLPHDVAQMIMQTCRNLCAKTSFDRTSITFSVDGREKSESFFSTLKSQLAIAGFSCQGTETYVGAKGMPIKTLSLLNLLITFALNGRTASQEFTATCRNIEKHIDRVQFSVTKQGNATYLRIELD